MGRSRGCTWGRQHPSSSSIFSHLHVGFTEPPSQQTLLGMHQDAQCPSVIKRIELLRLLLHLCNGYPHHSTNSYLGVPLPCTIQTLMAFCFKIKPRTYRFSQEVCPHKRHWFPWGELAQIVQARVKETTEAMLPLNREKGTRSSL